MKDTRDSSPHEGPSTFMAAVANIAATPFSKQISAMSYILRRTYTYDTVLNLYGNPGNVGAHYVHIGLKPPRITYVVDILIHLANFRTVCHDDWVRERRAGAQCRRRAKGLPVLACTTPDEQKTV